MLNVVQKIGEAKPTHILYKANLSYKRFSEYLQVLKEKGFVDEISRKGSSVYIITDRGREFIQEYGKLKQVSEAFGLPIF